MRALLPSLFPAFGFALDGANLSSAFATCSFLKDCGSCVDHALLDIHDCEWCEIDRACHELGSSKSPCLPELTKESCVSTASASHCTKRSADECSDTDAFIPRQVHLAFAGDAGMRVAWKTRAHVVCEVTATGGSSSVSGVYEGSKQYIKGYGFHHSAVLRNLVKGAAYQYSISCEGVSTERSFKVAPVDLESYTALVVGDMGYGSRGHAMQSRRMMEELKGSTDFMIHAGDIGYADDDFLHWDKCLTEFCYEAVYDAYMEWIENLTDTKAYMVTPGNHEGECHSPFCLVSEHHRLALRNFSAYNARWAMPAPESGGVLSMWYSFDYGPVHFVSLNTETDFRNADEGTHGLNPFCPSGSFAPDGEYLKWLEADLSKANMNREERPWIVTMGHRPWLHDAVVSADPAVEAAHAKLLEKYGVDLMLFGHKHAYHRFLPVEGNTAPPMVVTGGAGCDEGHDNVPNISGVSKGYDYLAMGSDYQVGALEVSRNQLTWRTYNSRTGDIFDTFNVSKKRELPVFML